jgi:hypothetical protein
VGLDPRAKVLKDPLSEFHSFVRKTEEPIGLSHRPKAVYPLDLRCQSNAEFMTQLATTAQRRRFDPIVRTDVHPGAVGY